MVPGAELAGLVSPSIFLPVLTTFRPAHAITTARTQREEVRRGRLDATTCLVWSEPRRAAAAEVEAWRRGTCNSLERRTHEIHM